MSYRNIYANIDVIAHVGTYMPITKRDRIWAAALHIADATESETAREQMNLSDSYGIPGFTVQDVKNDLPAPVAERTIRDCLNAMADLGILSKRESNPSRYRGSQSEK